MQNKRHGWAGFTITVNGGLLMLTVVLCISKPKGIPWDTCRLSTLTSCISWCGSDVIIKFGVRLFLTTNFIPWHHHPGSWGGRIVHETHVMMKSNMLTSRLQYFWYSWLSTLIIMHVVRLKRSFLNSSNILWSWVRHSPLKRVRPSCVRTPSVWDWSSNLRKDRHRC